MAMENQHENKHSSNNDHIGSPDESNAIDDLNLEMASEEIINIKSPMNKSKKILFAILTFIILVILGSLSGYWKGINDRVNYQEVLIATEASEQMVRALMDMNANNYSQAVERFEYIVDLDPNYPGVVELLAESLLILNNPSPTPTITLTPTITMTPTPDISGKEDLYQQAIIFNQAENWDQLISTLDQLRFEDQNFKTSEVNSLYFNGLRNRGVNRILVEGLLEAGIYDLTNAENFFPLDIQATNFRTWAEWYVTGASFWGVDWFQAIKYFKYIVPHVPNLMDSTYFTAKDRLATAEVIYPTEAVQRASIYLENQMYCEANQIFQYLSENYGPLSEEYRDPLLIARDRCNDLLATTQP